MMWFKNKILHRRYSRVTIKVVFILVFGLVGYIVLGLTRADALLTDRKMVWTTTAIPAQRDISNLNTSYGENYPLYIRQPGVSQAATTIKAVRQTGINGLAVFTGANGMNVMDQFGSEADKYKDILVAPMISSRSAIQSGAVDNSIAIQILRKQIDLYVKDIAPKHRSTAKVGNRYVVLSDGITSFSVTDWQKLQSQLHNEGISIYWVFDAGGHYGSDEGTLANQATVKAYTTTYNMGFPFNGRLNATEYAQTRSIIQSAHKAFAGGVAPGYFRGNRSDTGPQNPHGDDALATALYRQEFDMQTNLNWYFISTWDDIIEHTAVNKTSEWITTRTDLTAWYVAKSLGKPEPFSTPRLYVTTPQSVYKDQSRPAEALIINPTGQSLEARITLVSKNGVFLSQLHKTVAPHSVGSATLLVEGSLQPPSYFIRARATMSLNNNVISHVTSAPILIYPNSAAGKTLGPTLYDSIPADHALRSSVNLSVKRVSNGITSTVSTSSIITPKFSEVIHDTMSVTKANDSLLTNAPTQTSINANPVDYRGETSNYQLFMARAIDSQNRIGYSDPIYLPNIP